MKYTIQIDYTTGDSFRSNREIENVDLSWENLDIAKENLQRIKGHYQHYHTTHNEYCVVRDGGKEWGRYKSRQFFKDLEEEAKTKDWYHKGRPHYDFVIMLKLDDGTEHQYHTFWCGYFERLHTAEIIADPIEDHDMKITF